MTAALLVLLFGIAQAAEYSAPAGVRPALASARTTSVLPGGRMVAPAGVQFIAREGAFALAVSPSGKRVAVGNRGPERYSITFLDQSKGGQRLVRHELPPFSPDPGGWRGVSTGLVFDGESTLYASEGATGRVRAFNPSDGTTRRVFDLNQDGAGGSFTSEIAFDGERKLLHVVDSGASRLVTIDVNRRRVTGSVKLEGKPEALALSPDNRRAYIALPDSGSLAVVDLANPAAPVVSAGVPVAGRPAGIAVTASQVFVSDAVNDSVKVIDPARAEVIAEIPIRIPGLESLRGLAPAGLAYHEGAGWLLVAQSGANAVAFLDMKERRVLGHVPVGWQPARIIIDGDNAIVSNTRGHGSGPNTGRNEFGDEAPFGSRPGTVTVLPIPSLAELAAMTGRVIALNGFAPKPTDPPAIPAAIRHVVLIVKGSRAYDEVLGDIQQVSNGAVMGAPRMARFGMSGYGDGRNVRLSLQRVAVTPNHHRLTQQFAFSDNYYAQGTIPWERLERLGTTLRAEEGESDQTRAGQIIAAVRDKFGDGKAQFPRLVTIHLPDRAGEPRPGDGYPYEASYVADNDHALGRILEFLSHSPWWREMAVFVTESDARGLDHIDARRTVLLCAGPYFKRSYVSHINTGFGGLVKTIFRILGEPPASLDDATASEIADVWADTPDFTPYSALPPDKRLFDPDRISERRR